MSKVWQQSGNTFFKGDSSSQIDKLPLGVFLIKDNPRTGLYLDKVSENFTFNHKIYGKDQEFINRCAKTYQETSGNLGVLLSGTKGTGKSVTAKLLCNKMNLPVILVDSEYEDLDTFLAEINQEVVVMIDEYEKIFEKSHMLLSVMDGVSMSSFRRVFILSTNDSFINENMLNRPSRIRYHKPYGNLEPEICKEIIEDILKYPEHAENLQTLLSELEIVTIDLVISLINEINIHNEPASEFISYFNAEKTNLKFDVLDEEGNLVFAGIQFAHYNIVKKPNGYIGYSIQIHNENDDTIVLGTLSSVKSGVYTFKTDGKYDSELDEMVGCNSISYKIRRAHNLMYAY